ncbi:unnamed protein product [Coffea canephora]|uniref:Organ-specific protein P4-like n=1 Tax=Coffea canephora TaxID=49390 RepID=A0A068TZL8_COFCA|nr:uncharacterized protein LOC113697755 [Coffea arabica]CDP01517.1 unnamed protein product [Coffea canephora]
MRPYSAFLVLFLLVSFTFGIDARRCPGDYWKSVMNEEPIPEVLSDILHQDTTSEPCEKETVDTDRLARDFDMRSSVIIYHRDADSKRVKTFDAEGVKMRDNIDSAQSESRQKVLRAE